MKKLIILSAAFLLFSSHDMFLKMGTFFLQPNTPAAIQLFNGTFDNSENVIARKRMKDVSLLGNGVRTHPDTSQWSELDSATILNFKTGEPGTWVAGLSTNPNQIALSAQDFNDYLDHDGVIDMLEWRKKNNALDKPAVEKYSKHVKAIFQVGDKRSDDWKTVLGYPIEFVPERNPYDLKAGDALAVKLLRNGKPLANQLVYAGSDGGGNAHSHEGEQAHSHEAGQTHSHEGEHAHSHAGEQAHEHKTVEKPAESHHHDATKLRTDANGIVTLNLENEGHWYLRTILLEHSLEPGLTHESNWATLTFEVGHGHGDGATHSHADGQVHGHGIPAYAYWIGGLALVAGLFWYFRKRAR